MKKRILMALLAAMTAVSIAACSSEETAGDNVQESSEGNTSDNADLPENVDASAEQAFRCVIAISPEIRASQRSAA